MPDVYADIVVYQTPIYMDVVVGGIVQGSNIVFVNNETPTGAINGANATFTAAFPFKPESVEVYIECIKLRLLDDYQILNSTTIQLAFSPETGERLYLNYIKA